MNNARHALQLDSAPATLQLFASRSDRGPMDASTLRAHSWESLCQLCESHARRMARLCKFQEAGELTEVVRSKFCAQTPPTTDEELHIRRMQETHAASVIGSVVHADSDEVMRRYKP